MFIKPAESNPAIIVPEPGKKPGFTTAAFKGNLYRCYPRRARDVMFLLHLDHHQDKFAPAEGHGVFITERALEQFHS